MMHQSDGGDGVIGSGSIKSSNIRKYCPILMPQFDFCVNDNGNGSSSSGPGGFSSGGCSGAVVMPVTVAVEVTLVAAATW